MGCSSWMGPSFPSMASIPQGWLLTGVGTRARRTPARLASCLGYASRKGATLLDRRLYLPESWFAQNHRALWQDCQIPDETRFQTKHELAARLVENVMGS